MTDLSQLDVIKRLAKDFARGNRIPLHQSQKIVAGWLGFPHWPKLKQKIESGYKITDRDINYVVEKVIGDHQDPETGTVSGHDYQLSSFLGDVSVYGRGWSVTVFVAPLAPPQILVTDKRITRNPIKENPFLNEILKIARQKAEKVRADTVRNWPKRSLQPDKDGAILHPTNFTYSHVWYCLHCDADIAAKDIAQNFWYCPHCEATPIDIFATPFWRSPT